MAARQSRPPGHFEPVIRSATRARKPARNLLIAFDRAQIGAIEIDRRSLLDRWRPEKNGTPCAILLVRRNERWLIKDPHVLPPVPTHHGIIRRFHIFAVGERIVATI